MRLFEFDRAIKPFNLKRCYHNNITSNLIDLSDFYDDDLINILNYLLTFAKLTKIFTVNETKQSVLKIYIKPFLPKYFHEALKITTYEKITIKRNNYYKIKYKKVAEILGLTLDEVKNNFKSYQMFYEDKPFYTFDKKDLLFGYSFLMTPEMKQILNDSDNEQTVLDSEEYEKPKEEVDDFELRDFQKEELELMLNNDTFYFSNPPRVGTSILIAEYVKRRPNEKILIVVPRTALKLKFTQLIKSKNATIIVNSEFEETIEDKNFDTIICDECHHDYLYTFDETNHIVNRTKYRVYSNKYEHKTFFFSSTIPNDIEDLSNFYEYRYQTAINDGHVVKAKLNFINGNKLAEYVKQSKSQHIVIVSEENIVNKFKKDSVICISRNDEVSKRHAKVEQFLNVPRKPLICPTIMLEGFDLPCCDEIILYNVNYSVSGAIQVCGRCIEKLPWKKQATITIIDKTDFEQIVQYFVPYLYYQKDITICNELKTQGKKYLPYDFISDFDKCLEILTSSFDNMDNYFDKSKIDRSILNLLFRTQNGKNIVKEFIQNKFNNVDYYIKLIDYEITDNSKILTSIPRNIRQCLSVNSENTSQDNICRINGFNYKLTRMKPKITNLKSQVKKDNTKNTFYKTYGTSQLNPDDILFYQDKFYIWKNVSK